MYIFNICVYRYASWYMIGIATQERGLLCLFKIILPLASIPETDQGVAVHPFRRHQHSRKRYGRSFALWSQTNVKIMCRATTQDHDIGHAEFSCAVDAATEQYLHNGLEHVINYSGTLKNICELFLIVFDLRQKTYWSQVFPDFRLQPHPMWKTAILERISKAGQESRTQRTSQMYSNIFTKK